MVPSPAPVSKTYTILLSQAAGTQQVQIQSVAPPKIDGAGRLIFGDEGAPVAAFDTNFWVACIDPAALVAPAATPAAAPSSTSGGLTSLFGGKA